MKKLFIYSLAFVTSMSFYACSDLELEKDSFTTEELSTQTLNEESYVEGDASHQEEANQKITKLNESFGQVRNLSGVNTINYPSYYGGSFITDEGKLIIYIVGDIGSSKKQISTLIGDSNTEYRPAKYSYATLTGLMRNLGAYMEDNIGASTTKDIVMYSLRDMENKIVVQVLNLSEDKKLALKNTPFDNPAIELHNTNEPFRNEVNLNPGSRIDEAPGGSAGSIAFRARNSSGQVGFVTTGHLFSVGDNAYRSGNIVGSVTINQNSGSVDAAFVKLTNTSVDDVTNTIDGTSNLLSTSTSLPGVGTTINLRGFASGSQSGKIISTNADAWVGSVHFTNLTEANYTSTGGDSGGLIYSFISSSGTRPTVGVHKGSLPNGNAVFSKASQVLSALNVTRN